MEAVALFVEEADEVADEAAVADTVLVAELTAEEDALVVAEDVAVVRSQPWNVPARKSATASLIVCAKSSQALCGPANEKKLLLSQALNGVSRSLAVSKFVCKCK